MAKKTSSAVELKAQLETALPDAERQVVEAAVDCIGPNGAHTVLTPLHEAVANLNAIRAAHKAISAVTKKSGKSPALEPAAKAAD